MRVLYGERLRLLQQAVEHHFGDAIDFSDGDAGLHLALHLPRGCDDVAISNEARAAGIITRPLSGYYMQPASARRGLMLGYACVPNEQIAPAFDKLAGIIKKHWPA
jgi:GntR family transcriptional regulator/MocR family aminotransferase